MRTSRLEILTSDSYALPTLAVQFAGRSEKCYVRLFR